MAFNHIHAQIKINEVFMNPSANVADRVMVDCSQPANGMQWVELYNSSKCDTINLNCFILGSSISAGNAGSFTFPANTLLPPLHFFLVGGAAVPNVDFSIPSFCNAGNVCTNGSWSLPIDSGWVALYNAQGGVVDAVYWTAASGEPGLLGSSSVFSGKPCVPPDTNCTRPATLGSAKLMSQGTQILYAGAVAAQGKSIYRSTDGSGGWQTGGTPTPKACNGICVTPSSLAASLDSSANESCRLHNGALTVSGRGGVPPYQYLWNTQLRTQNIDSLVAGVYSVTIVDDSNCHFIFTDTLMDKGDSVFVSVTPKNVTIFKSDTVHLNVTTASLISSIAWSPTDGLTCIQCSDPVAKPTVNTAYVVAVTDVNGCVGTDTSFITLLADANSIFVPNAFTPDGATNNILYVRSSKLTGLDFHIFDRWGKEVFASEDLTTGWNGRDKGGNRLNAGVYVYYVQATFADGTHRTLNGDVTLLR